MEGLVQKTAKRARRQAGPWREVGLFAMLAALCALQQAAPLAVGLRADLGAVAPPSLLASLGVAALVIFAGVMVDRGRWRLAAGFAPVLSAIPSLALVLVPSRVTLLLASIAPAAGLALLYPSMAIRVIRLFPKGRRGTPLAAILAAYQTGSVSWMVMLHLLGRTVSTQAFVILLAVLALAGAVTWRALTPPNEAPPFEPVHEGFAGLRLLLPGPFLVLVLATVMAGGALAEWTSRFGAFYRSLNNSVIHGLGLPALMGPACLIGLAVAGAASDALAGFGARRLPWLSGGALAASVVSALMTLAESRTSDGVLAPLATPVLVTAALLWSQVSVLDLTPPNLVGRAVGWLSGGLVFSSLFGGPLLINLIQAGLRGLYHEFTFRYALTAAPVGFGIGALLFMLCAFLLAESLRTGPEPWELEE
jgi:Major Facilitator Superfamily